MCNSLNSVVIQKCFRCISINLIVKEKVLYRLSGSLTLLGISGGGYNVSHTLLRPSQFLEELLEIFLMVHFAEISQVSPPY